MAITIDPLTFVIYVPKADLTLLQASPEVRELDLDWFRLELKDIEDDPSYGIYLYKTHNHNTAVTLAGLTYARIIEILAPYTVEFEDGQYTVNCTGANHNVSDVKVANQVSLIVNNAAGLITNTAIEYSSFQGAVHLDTTTSYTGTVFPVGTPQRPVNNLTDALLIASTRGFTKLMIYNDLTLDAAYDLDDYTIQGVSESVILTIDSIASVQDLTLRNLTIADSTLDGNVDVRDCLVRDVSYVDGYIHSCGLAGTITLAGGRKSVMADCYTVDQDDPPIIDMGASGNDLAMPNYSGIVTFQNFSGASNELGVGLDAGVVYLDSTVSAGTIIISGIGTLVDNSTGAPVINTDGIVNVDQISAAVWNSVLSAQNYNVPNSAGRRLRQLSSNVVLEGTVISATINTITFDGDASTEDGAYDPAIITITANTGVGQTRLILEYNGTTKTAVVDRDWKVLPDNTSEFLITGNAGREHVNEGLAQGGTINTITLNALASNYDDAYMGQTIFLRSGYGEDQVRHVIAYNGTTKVAMVEHDWDVIPNATTGYVMLPQHTHLVEHIGEAAADAVWAHDDALGIMSDLSFIKGIEGGRWLISNGQMIFYADDNITELARFDLTYDVDMNPVERNRV